MACSTVINIPDASSNNAKRSMAGLVKKRAEALLQFQAFNPCPFLDLLHSSTF